jgi:hypothetical protein
MQQLVVLTIRIGQTKAWDSIGMAVADEVADLIAQEKPTVCAERDTLAD